MLNCCLLPDQWQQQLSSFQTDGCRHSQTHTHLSICAVLPTLFSLALYLFPGEYHWGESLQYTPLHPYAHIHTQWPFLPLLNLVAVVPLRQTHSRRLLNGILWHHRKRGWGGGATWQNNRHVITLLAFHMTSSSTQVPFSFSPQCGCF